VQDLFAVDHGREYAGASRGAAGLASQPPG
jgi:hypothetical protein